MAAIHGIMNWITLYNNIIHKIALVIGRLFNKVFFTLVVAIGPAAHKHFVRVTAGFII